MRIRNQLFLGLLTLAAAGCNFGTSADAADVPAQSPSTDRKNPWVSFKSEAGNFAASFPLEPTQKELPTQSGIVRHRFSAVLDGGQLVYSVYYADGKPVGEIPHTLKQAQDAMVQTQGGTLLKEAAIQLGDWHGREFSFSFKSKDGPGVMHNRLYVVDQRFYSVVVGGPRDRVVAGDVERFFRSFSVLEKK